MHGNLGDLAVAVAERDGDAEREAERHGQGGHQPADQHVAARHVLLVVHGVRVGPQARDHPPDVRRLRQANTFTVCGTPNSSLDIASDLFSHRSSNSLETSDTIRMRRAITKRTITTIRSTLLRLPRTESTDEKQSYEQVASSQM